MRACVISPMVAVGEATRMMPLSAGNFFSASTTAAALLPSGSMVISATGLSLWLAKAAWLEVCPLLPKGSFWYTTAMLVCPMDDICLTMVSISASVLARTLNARRPGCWRMTPPPAMPPTMGTPAWVMTGIMALQLEVPQQLKMATALELLSA